MIFSGLSCWIKKHPIFTSFGMIFVGAMGSGFWEVGLKPLGSLLIHCILFVVSLGSDSLRDSAYASATMDQSAIFSAILVNVGLAVVFTGFLIMVSREFPAWTRSAITSLDTEAPLPDEQDSEIVKSEKLYIREAKIGTALKKLILYRRVLVASFGLLVGFFAIIIMVNNQSLSIWRSFHADLRICAPKLSAQEEELLLSRFSAMKSKRDYDSVLIVLRGAAPEGVTLHSESLW